MQTPRRSTALKALCAALVLAAAASPRAQGQDEAALSEEEKSRLAAELEKLKERSVIETEAGLRAAKTALEEALASDTRLAQLYTDAVRTTEFRGLKNGSEMFTEWRKKNDAALGAPETRAAIRRHAEYLLLTIKALAGAKQDALMEELLAYAAALEKDARADRSHPLLTRPLYASPVARALGIGLPKGEWSGWAAEAGNSRAMFERLILPWMRERKDARLLDYWKLRIEAESGRAAAERVEFRASALEKTELPRLRWLRARDAALLGHEAAAVREMMDILRSAPAHPDFDSWAAELGALLAPQQTGEKAGEHEEAKP